jgi:uncharacterized cupredoxin-like copper-binding protein
MQPMALSLRGIVIGAAVLAASTAFADSGHSHSAFAAGDVGVDGSGVRVVELDMTEGNGTMAYSLSKIEVSQNETVRFVLKNAGMLDHEFVLGTRADNRAHAEMMASMPDMGHSDKNMTQVSSGQSSSFIWKFSNKGEFEFACLIPGHYEAGMHGIMIVK